MIYAKLRDDIKDAKRVCGITFYPNKKNYTSASNELEPKLKEYLHWLEIKGQNEIKEEELAKKKKAEKIVDSHWKTAESMIKKNQDVKILNFALEIAKQKEKKKIVELLENRISELK